MSNPTQLSDAAAALKARIAQRSGAPVAPVAPVAAAPVRCAVCNDLGVVRRNLPHDDPDYGRLVPCPACAPKPTRGIYGLTLAEQELSWASVRPFPVTIRAGDMVRNSTALGLAQMLERECKPAGAYVFLYGLYGMGKTHMLKTAVAEALRAGRRAHYVNLSEILDDIRDAFDSSDPRDSALTRYRRWSSIDFLAVDELDKPHTTEWALAQMFRLLNARYEMAMAGTAVTIMASNRAPGDLDAALGSRAGDGRSVYLRLSGRDVRPMMTR